MFMDLKEVVPDPIKGNPDVAFRVEFSRLDAERGFIESQDRETAMLAMLTGDEELLSQSSSLDYSECANRLLPPLATCPPYSLCLHCLGALQVHSIPGAESLELYFDRRSSTEEDHDVVRVYAGASFNRLVLEHSGGTTSRWPGTAGVPPVVVPGDTFGVSFRADISDTSWGWAITARARVPHALVTKLHTLLSSHGVEMSDNVLEAALAQHKLSVDDAKTLLLDENEGPRFQREHQQQFSVGYYQRKGHNMRVNLQAAEVYLSTNSGGTRMQMPTPPLIAHNPDFKAVFEGANKCAPLHTALGHAAPLHSAVGHVSPSLPPLALLTPYPLIIP